jgi:hypothetical protein
MSTPQSTRLSVFCDRFFASANCRQGLSRFPGKRWPRRQGVAGMRVPRLMKNTLG